MKRKNSQSVISLTSLREIQNIISPVPTKSEIRKSVEDELKKIIRSKSIQMEKHDKKRIKNKIRKRAS